MPYKNYEDQVKCQTQIRVRNRKFINEQKSSKGCIRCGYNEHPAALDFHHVRDKNKKVSSFLQGCYSIEKIQNEIDKCEVLCSNCHRIRHYEQRNAPMV